MKKNFNNIFYNFQTCVHGLRPDWFHQSGEYAFKFFFGEKFNSFKNIFDHNIDQLKKQLDKEELHECDSKTCLAVLKKQFETFFDPKSPLSYQYQSGLARQKEKFQEYAHYDTVSLKKTILSYLNSIEKRIDERACHEEELRIKERNVKDRRNEEGKSSSLRNDTDAEGAKISKNGSDYDITNAKSSHDKDKTEVQWSNNGLFENDYEVEKTNENNKVLKEANDLLTKELKPYKEKVRVFEISKGNNTTFFNEFIEADSKARQLHNDLQNQFIRDRDKIRDLEQQRDSLQLKISYQKGHISSVRQEQDTLKANLKHSKDKYLNDILQLQAKNKDLENNVCPCVLSQANANIPKLYNDYELRDENVQLHVFDSEKTLEDAEKSQLKMKEFQKDEKVQELKIKPIDYLKLNKLYETFVPQVELSPEQKYFSETFKPSENPSNASTSKSPCASMPKVKPILHNLHLNLEIFQKRFSEDIKEIMDVFYLMESDLDKTLKQLLEATLAEDVKNLVIPSCVEIGNKNLQNEIERFSKESKDVSNESKIVYMFCNDAFDVTKEMSKRIVDLEKDLSKLETKSIAFDIALQHKSQENNSLKTLQKENENFLASLQIEMHI
ncbi:hypothetical protein Tco_1028729 [Tanacetum coccineum]|uniref:Uncharacterized protein n=1 Tax=Tanacetum coccineum TaxID=301880 RepID=A0ABQ5G2X3_9ASTR